MSNRTTRLALALAAGAASFAMSTPADAGIINCTLSHIDIPNLNFNVGGTVNCSFDQAGLCLFYYDPLFSFPERVVDETIEYTFCNAF